MRFSAGYFQEENLLFIHGGGFKIYGKQKITLSSIIMVNL